MVKNGRANRRMPDDFGVSEILGSILVFGIVISGIALIILAGTVILNNSKEVSNFQNVEQGFKIVQSDMKRVALEHIPNKTSRMHLEGGTLITDYTTSDILVDYPPMSPDYHVKPGEMRFVLSSGEKALSIENGGLWKTYGTDLDVMVSEPRIFAWPEEAPGTNINALVINVIKIEGQPTTYAGTSTMNTVMEYVGSDVRTYKSANADGDTVTIDITSRYPNAWKRSLEEIPGTGTVTSPDKVQYVVPHVKVLTINTHTVRISQYTYT